MERSEFYSTVGLYIRKSTTRKETDRRKRQRAKSKRKERRVLRTPLFGLSYLPFALCLFLSLLSVAAVRTTNVSGSPVVATGKLRPQCKPVHRQRPHRQPDSSEPSRVRLLLRCCPKHQ